MKSKMNYPRNDNRTKVFIVVGLVFIQTSLMAIDSSCINQGTDQTGNTSSEYAEFPAEMNAEDNYINLDEVALEAEYELEDWMCNIHTNAYNTQKDEDDIEMEEWMYNTQHSFWWDLNETRESEPEIESWMTNPNDWNYPGNDLMLSLN